MPQQLMPTVQRILLTLAVLGLIVAGCAPAATEEPAAPPPVVTETEETLPEVPDLTPREPAPEEPLDEAPIEEEPVEEEPVEEEPVEEEPVEEEPVEEEPVEEEPIEEEPVEEGVVPADEPFTLAVNAGGPEVVAGGVTWTADQFFEGGRTTSNEVVTEIEGTDNDEIYLNARVADANLDGFSYSIPVPTAGVYEVRLHFAELYFGAPGGGSGGGEGDRVFNVSFEGGAVELTGIDLVAETGAMNAVVKAFEVPVEDGVLDITFTASVNRPLVSALEVLGPTDMGTGN
ncbi:MAG: malectin [Deinococcota bacterium]|nr:malectin [Deinococcota bacterium]